MRLLTFARFRGKKGMIGYEAVMTIVRTLMLVFTLISLVMVANFFIERHVDTRFIESHVAMNYAYYSSTGLAYQDPKTERVYAGLIDSGKGPIDGSFDFGASLASRAVVSLPGSEREFYYEETLFKDWDFLYRAGLTKGVGGVSKVGVARKLPLLEGGSIKTADVKLEVVSRND